MAAQTPPGCGQPANITTQYTTALAHQVVLRKSFVFAVDCEFKDKSKEETYKNCLERRKGSKLTEGECRKILGPHYHLLEKKDLCEFDVSNLSLLQKASFNSRDRTLKLQMLTRKLNSAKCQSDGQIRAHMRDVLKESHKLHDIDGDKRKENERKLAYILDEPERLKRLYAARKELQYACRKKDSTDNYLQFLVQKKETFSQEESENILWKNEDFLQQTNASGWTVEQCCCFLIAYYGESETSEEERKLWQQVKLNGAKNAGKKWPDNMIQAIADRYPEGKNELDVMKNALLDISKRTQHTEEARDFILSTALTYECSNKPVDVSYKEFLEQRKGGPLSQEELDNFAENNFLKKTDTAGLSATNMCELSVALYKVRDPCFVVTELCKKAVKKLRNDGIHDPNRANDPNYLSDAREAAIQFVRDCGRAYKLSDDQINTAVTDIEERSKMKTKEEQAVADVNNCLKKCTLHNVPQTEIISDVEKKEASTFLQNLGTLFKSGMSARVLIVSKENESGNATMLQTIDKHIRLALSHPEHILDFNFCLYFSLEDTTCESMRNLVETNLSSICSEVDSNTVVKGVLQLETLYLINNYENINCKSNDLLLDLLNRTRNTQCQIVISCCHDKLNELQSRLKEEKHEFIMKSMQEMTEPSNEPKMQADGTSNDKDHSTANTKGKIYDILLHQSYVVDNSYK